MESPSPSSSPPPEPRRYKLTIAYDGSGFHGWQRQADLPGSDGQGGRPLRTVAGVMEEALREVMRQPVRLVGASRTDAGVHALGQVAHFDAATRIPIERMALALNSRLPDEIDVRHAEVVSPDFDAISGATWKQYRYRLFNTWRRPLDRRHHVYHCWTPLDIERMRDAAALFVGTHDFAGFAAADHGRTTTVRTVFHCGVERARGLGLPVCDDGGPGRAGVDAAGPRDAGAVPPAALSGQFAVGDPDAPEVHIVVQGNGFLYNMVRIIAGTLVEIGRGRLDPSIVRQVLVSKDRRLAGPTMPPQGLWLEWIRYDAAPGHTASSST